MIIAQKAKNLQVKLTGSLMAGLKETKESGVSVATCLLVITRIYRKHTQMREDTRVLVESAEFEMPMR